MAELPSDNTTRRYSSRLHGQNVVGGFQNLWERKLMCDTTLVVQGKAFQVHRCYLASCSQYFYIMFTEGFQECNQTEVELKGVTAKGLEAMLHYVYTGTIELNQDNVPDVLEASSHLQFKDVQKFCAEYLKEELSVDNCLQFLKVTELYALEWTKSDIMNFMFENFVSVAQQAEFSTISVDLLCELLADDSLNAESELLVFRIAVRWLKHEPDRYNHAERVLRLVRFGLMTPEEMEVVYSNEIMMLPSCRELLQMTLNYHMKLFQQPIIDTPIARPRSYVDSLLVFGAGKTDNSLSNLVLATRIDNKDLVGFTAIGKPKEARYFAAVAVLNNFVFVVGGQTAMAGDGSHATNSAFRYNPRDGKWLQISSMSTPRTHFALVALPDCLIAVGGKHNRVAVASVEKYSFQENEWSKAPKLSSTLFSHAGCAHSGRVYISGGCPGEDFTDHVHCYDPAREAWQLKSPMNQSRGYHIMVPHRDKIFVCAGNTNAGNRADVMHTEMYDVERDQWSMVAAISQGQSEAPAVRYGSCFFILGGYSWNMRSFQDTIQRYDMDTDEWTVIDTKLPEAMTGVVASYLKLPHRVYQYNATE